MAIRGQSLELFFIDGTPDGMLTAEIFNWTGQVLVTPRIRLPEALARVEASYPGVYILLGANERGDLVRAYIGESENVGARIRTHDAKRDWWTQVVLITSKTNTLNKAHVQYLESRLIDEAKKAGRMKLENATAPSLPTLSDAAKANMEQFAEHIFTVLPAVRIDGFLNKTRQNATPSIASTYTPSSSPTVFLLKLKNDEANASAILANGEFIVQAGSLGRSSWIGVDHNYRKLYTEVVESGIFVIDGRHRKFIKAYSFSSPSAAGAVLNGRATAGPLAWVLASDPRKTYKAWEADQLKLTPLQDPTTST